MSDNESRESSDDSFSEINLDNNQDLSLEDIIVDQIVDDEPNPTTSAQPSTSNQVAMALKLAEQAALIKALEEKNRLQAEKIRSLRENQPSSSRKRNEDAIEEPIAKKPNRDEAEEIAQDPQQHINQENQPEPPDPHQEAQIREYVYYLGVFHEQSLSTPPSHEIDDGGARNDDGNQGGGKGGEKSGGQDGGV